MTIFYRGAGVGTYWHTRDARSTDFTSKVPEGPNTVHRMMEHVARANLNSPYVSLTQSYGVALNYALHGRVKAEETNPAYVYEVEIPQPLPQGLQLIDPVQEILRASPEPPASASYHHDGDQEFLHGIISPSMSHYLERQVKHPPPYTGTPRTPNLTIELETLVRALRDAEVLALGTIPSNCVVNRYRVW